MYCAEIQEINQAAVMAPSAPPIVNGRTSAAVVNMDSFRIVKFYMNKYHPKMRNLMNAKNTHNNKGQYSWCSPDIKRQYGDFATFASQNTKVVKWRIETRKMYSQGLPHPAM